MTVEYNKGTACPILLSIKESAVALTMDSAKKLQADLAKVIEQAEKEPEMTEFENGMLRYLQDAANKKDDSEIVESTKEHSIKLLSLARNEFNKQIENDYREIIHGAYERGKADAEQAVERRLQSGELMTQEHHEKLMETLREECKKDLPRWRNVEADKRYVGCVTRYMDVNGDWNYCMSSGKLSDDCQYISIAALEKLPKENESHE